MSLEMTIILFSMEKTHIHFEHSKEFDLLFNKIKLSLYEFQDISEYMVTNGNVQ